MDVTPTSAMVSWDFGGLDPRYVQMYDVKVKSGTNLTLVTKQLGRDTNALRINLQAGRFRVHCVYLHNRASLHDYTIVYHA